VEGLHQLLSEYYLEPAPITEVRSHVHNQRISPQNTRSFRRISAHSSDTLKQTHWVYRNRSIHFCSIQSKSYPFVVPRVQQLLDSPEMSTPFVCSTLSFIRWLRPQEVFAGFGVRNASRLFPSSDFLGLRCRGFALKSLLCAPQPSVTRVP
jgi:hypothetical protein